MTAEGINTKQGLTQIPTYAELIKEIDREKFKTNDIRIFFYRNAWYFHESPQGQALNTSNIHPADLQQMNFKKMAEEATARKKEKTPNLDFEDMTDLRDDAISDFEMTFDREAELRLGTGVTFAPKRGSHSPLNQKGSHSPLNHNILNMLLNLLG